MLALMPIIIDPQRRDELAQIVCPCTQVMRISAEQRQRIVADLIKERRERVEGGRLKNEVVEDLSLASFWQRHLHPLYLDTRVFRDDGTWPGVPLWLKRPTLVANLNTTHRLPVPVALPVAAIAATQMESQLDSEAQPEAEPAHSKNKQPCPSGAASGTNDMALSLTGRLRRAAGRLAAAHSKQLEAPQAQQDSARLGVAVATVLPAGQGPVAARAVVPKVPVGRVDTSTLSSPWVSTLADSSKPEARTSKPDTESFDSVVPIGPVEDH